MNRGVIFDCFGVLAEDGWGPFKAQHFADKPDALREVAAIGRLVDAGKCSVDVMITAIARSLRMHESEVRASVNRRVPNEALFAYIENELKPKYRIGLLSNASYDICAQLFTPQQSRLFDAVVLSYDVGMTKTNPAMYQMILDQLGLPAEACVMVDDQQRYCDAARHMGMQAVQYENFEQAKFALQACA